MKDYSNKMRSMDLHRGDNYEMNILVEKPDFEPQELKNIFNALELKWSIQEEDYLVSIENFEYQIVLSKSVERNDQRLKISQKSEEELIWKRENNLLSITYLLWSELAGKIPYETGEGYAVDKWDQVYVLNNIEYVDFENYYEYRLFTATDLKNWWKNRMLQNIKLEITLKGDASVCVAAKKEFSSAFDFWVVGTSQLVCRGERGSSDLWDGRFLPISKENLEKELDVLGSNLDLLLKGKSFKSAMKMRFDRAFLGWYFVESENHYLIIDLARYN